MFCFFHASTIELIPQSPGSTGELGNNITNSVGDIINSIGDIMNSNSWYVHIVNSNSWYVNWIRDMYISRIQFVISWIEFMISRIEFVIITNWIRDITNWIRDMYISWIQFEHITNLPLNSKTASHTTARIDMILFTYCLSVAAKMQKNAIFSKT